MITFRNLETQIKEFSTLDLCALCGGQRRINRIAHI